MLVIMGVDSGQRLQIELNGQKVRVELLEVRKLQGNRVSVKLGFTADPGIKIHRQETLERIETNAEQR